MINCPNCGAPVTKSKCEYCDTVFFDLQTQDLEMEILREKQKNLQEQLFRINFSASQCANLQTLIQDAQLRNMNHRAILYADNVPISWY